MASGTYAVQSVLLRSNAHELTAFKEPGVQSVQYDAFEVAVVCRLRSIVRASVNESARGLQHYKSRP